MRQVLHVGCGTSHAPECFFPRGAWLETRLDIDPDVKPDIVGSITDMPVPDGAMDAIFSAHNLEHIAPHSVPKALAEFNRVLRPGGVAVIQVPDLQAAARRIADGEGHQTCYEAPCGPITAFDIVFGWSVATSGNDWMAHRCGYTADTLHDLLCAAGFRDVTVTASNWAIDAVGVKDGDRA